MEKAGTRQYSGRFWRMNEVVIYGRTGIRNADK